MSRLWIVVALGLLAVFATPDMVEAQCSMCRTALEQNAQAATAFNRAILFLLGAPYLLFATVGGLFLWSQHKKANAPAPDVEAAPTKA